MTIIVTQLQDTGYTLLEFMQDVADELSINRPTNVIGSFDPQIRQLLALANRLGRDLVREAEWQKLNKQYSLTTIGAQTTYSLPVDWNRQIPQTEWDRTSHWPLIGPATTQQWQLYQSGVVSQGPQIRFRINQDAVEIFPAQDGFNIVFNYVSDYWIIGADGTAKSRFTADTDTFVFDDSLMITGLKTLWKQAKGLDATFDLAEFRNLLQACKGQDKSAQKLSLSNMPRSVLLTEWNVQDGSWPAN